MRNAFVPPFPPPSTPIFSSSSSRFRRKSLGASAAFYVTTYPLCSTVLPYVPFPLPAMCPPGKFQKSYNHSTEMENVRISDFHGFPLSPSALFDFPRRVCRSFLFRFFFGVCLCVNYSTASLFFISTFYFILFFGVSSPESTEYIAKQRIIRHHRFHTMISFQQL